MAALTGAVTAADYPRGPMTVSHDTTIASAAHADLRNATPSELIDRLREPQLAELDSFHTVAHQVLGEQLIQARRLLQAAQLHQNGQQARQAAGQGADQLAQRRSAPAETPSTMTNRAQSTPSQPISSSSSPPGAASACASSSRYLRDVQLRRVAAVGGDPVGLPRRQCPQVDQPLLFHEAAQPYTEPPRRAGEISAAGARIYQFGWNLRVGDRE